MTSIWLIPKDIISGVVEFLDAKGFTAFKLTCKENYKMCDHIKFYDRKYIYGNRLFWAVLAVPSKLGNNNAIPYNKHVARIHLYKLINCFQTLVTKHASASELIGHALDVIGEDQFVDDFVYLSNISSRCFICDHLLERKPLASFTEFFNTEINKSLRVFKLNIDEKHASTWNKILSKINCIVAHHRGIISEACDDLINNLLDPAILENYPKCSNKFSKRYIYLFKNPAAVFRDYGVTWEDIKNEKMMFAPETFWREMMGEYYATFKRQLFYAKCENFPITEEILSESSEYRTDYYDTCADLWNFNKNVDILIKAKVNGYPSGRLFSREQLIMLMGARYSIMPVSHGYIGKYKYTEKDIVLDIVCKIHNGDFTINDVINNTSIIWNYYRILAVYGFNRTYLKLLEEKTQHPFDPQYTVFRETAIIDNEYVRENIDLEWDFKSLSTTQNFDWGIAYEYPYKHWNWKKNPEVIGKR